MVTTASTLVLPITLTASTSTPVPSLGANSSNMRGKAGSAVGSNVEPGVEVEGVVCVAGMVEAGSDVGVDAGLAVGLSPPHAVRINTKVRIMPGMAIPGKRRSAGANLKIGVSGFYDLGVAGENSAFALPIIKTGIAHCF